MSLINRKNILFILLHVLILVAPSYANAQNNNYSIEGWVKTGFSAQGVPGVKIKIRDDTLNSAPTYALTDSSGHFIVYHKSDADSVRVEIRYLFCTPFIGYIPLDAPIIKMDTVFLDQNETLLNTIDITAKTEPVYERNDTLFYDPAYFTTSANASVEELLEILPGVTVDRDGQIRVNGIEVNYILVNGKPFFGSDLTIATRNLSKDMLERIEVVNSRTEVQIFTDEDGDRSHKTINLVLKDEASQGYFGEIMVGTGLQNKYELNGMLNHFTKNRQISAIGGSNNINSPRFNSSQSGLSTDLSSTTGIIGSIGGGLNYAHDINQKIRLNTSYFLSSVNTTNGVEGKRIYLLPTNSYTQFSSSTSSLAILAHNLKASFILKPDKMTLIDFRTELTRDNYQNTTLVNQNSYTDTNLLINHFFSQNDRSNLQQNSNNTLTIIRKLGDQGMNVKLNYGLHLNSLLGDRKSESNTNFEDGTSSIIRNQSITDQQQRIEHKATISLKIPQKKMFTTLGLNLYRMYVNTAKNVWNIDLPNNANYDPILSTAYQRFDADFSPFINFFVRQDKWNFNFQPSLHFRTLNNTDSLRPQLSANRKYNVLEMNATFNYQLKTYKNLSCAYYLSNAPPTITQLLNFVDLNDPLNTIVGNPTLKPQKTHLLRLGLNHHNYKKRFGLYSYFSALTIIDQIIDISTIDNNLIKTNTFTNTNGNFDFSLAVVLDKKFILDSTYTFGMNLSINNSISRTINAINDLHYKNHIWLSTPSLNLSARIKNRLELSLNYQFVYTKTFYEITQLSPYNFNRNTIKLGVILQLNKTVEWNNSVSTIFDMGSNSNLTKSIWLWNTALYYQLKKSPITIGLLVYDSLAQNANVQRNINSVYIEDLQNLVLERYIMLSLTYKFRN